MGCAQHYRSILIGLAAGTLFPLDPIAAGGLQPVWVIDGPRIPGERWVSPDGLVVELQDRAPIWVTGPLTPGEAEWIGSFSPGLLPAAERRLIEEQFPAVAEKQNPGDGSLSEGVRSSERFVVVLDPGHGGIRSGAVGPGRVMEKVITLEIAQLVRREFEGVPGVEVVMIRDTDEDVQISERVDLANQVRADLFLSIHCNGFKRGWYRGLETFFHSVEASGDEARRVASEENSVETGKQAATPDVVASILQDMQRAEVLRDSSRMAQLLHERLLSVLGFPDHGVMQADFAVLRGAEMPSVLIELGFITNPVEAKAVRDPRVQKRVAAAIRDAVVEYRKLLEKKKVRPLTGGRVP